MKHCSDKIESDNLNEEKNYVDDFDEFNVQDDFDPFDDDEDEFNFSPLKTKNCKSHDINTGSKSKKPQWRADRKKAKKFKQEMQGSSD